MGKKTKQKQKQNNVFLQFIPETGTGCRWSCFLVWMPLIKRVYWWWEPEETLGQTIGAAPTGFWSQRGKKTKTKNLVMEKRNQRWEKLTTGKIRWSSRKETGWGDRDRDEVIRRSEVLPNVGDVQYNPDEARPISCDYSRTKQEINLNTCCVCMCVYVFCSLHRQHTVTTGIDCHSGSEWNHVKRKGKKKKEKKPRLHVGHSNRVSLVKLIIIKEVRLR